MKALFLNKQNDAPVGGILTWRIQNDRMNTTKSVEHDQKIHTGEN